MGLEGVVRGKPHRTRRPDKAAPRPLDRVKRRCRAQAPNSLLGADFICVSTWKGLAYVTFVIDVFTRTDAGIKLSVGSLGGGCDNAPAATINGLFKAKVIGRRWPLRPLEAIERATLERVDGYSSRRLRKPIAHFAPAEAELRTM
jgi:transposase InsO family protein